MAWTWALVKADAGHLHFECGCVAECCSTACTLLVEAAGAGSSANGVVMRLAAVGKQQSGSTSCSSLCIWRQVRGSEHIRQLPQALMVVGSLLCAWHFQG